MSRHSLTLLLLLGALFALGLGALVVADAHLGPGKLVLGALVIGLFSVQVTALRLLQARDRQLRDVFEAVHRVANGEIHVFVPEQGKDEAGVLAAEVNRLLASVRDGRLADEAERQLDRAMVRETPNGLVVTDVHGKVRRVNPAMGLLLPIEGDPIGKRPIETIPVPALQEVLDETARTRITCERHSRVGARDLLFRGVPTADGAGCLGMVLDITSVRDAERVRRDFVANVSHELRTPITAVIGYAEVLTGERERLPPDLTSMVEAISRNAERLSLLIEDVLHLSRIEARQTDLDLEAELLAPLIQQVLARFTGRAAQRHIAVTTEPFGNVRARVNVEAFDHALSNLVDNAIKYTHDEGKVRVAVATDADGVSVSVTDDGIGIGAMHHGRIFERFYRVDPARDRSIGGTGLGLALVKHLCLATNSEVTLESEPGKGSTFTLRLPRA